MARKKRITIKGFLQAVGGAISTAVTGTAVAYGLGKVGAATGFYIKNAATNKAVASVSAKVATVAGKALSTMAKYGAVGAKEALKVGAKIGSNIPGSQLASKGALAKVGSVFKTIGSGVTKVASGAKFALTKIALPAVALATVSDVYHMSKDLVLQIQGDKEAGNRLAALPQLGKDSPRTFYKHILNTLTGKYTRDYYIGQDKVVDPFKFERDILDKIEGGLNNARD